MSNSDKYKKAEMVGWYDLRQLFVTGVKTAISQTIGEYADPRATAGGPRNRKPFDYSKQLKKQNEDGEFLSYEADETDNVITQSEREEIWIDYAADVGDGWNSTYGVAYNMAQPTLAANGDVTERGEILIFGGDGVYPTADSFEYGNRLVTPYRMAFKAGGTGGSDVLAPVDLKKSPHLFALPGNHDWYDSLVAFKKLFCSHIFNDRKFANDEVTGQGGWQTRQKRSYFALKLPKKWWLLGVDMQLSHNIDIPQLEYFQDVINEMEKGDKIILCVPEPYWVRMIKYQDLTDEYLKKEASIEKLEAFFKGEKNITIKAFIAGDLHHYRRFEATDGSNVQKFTAGGGGAFLHPTHDYNFRKCEEKDYKKLEEKGNIKKRFSLKREYPSPEVSKKMDWKNFGFIFYNKTFGLATAVIYSTLAWMIHGNIKEGDGVFNWYRAFKSTLNRFIEEPLAALVVTLMMLGLVAFTKTSSKIQKWLGGAAHGLAHLTAVFFLGWFGYLAALRILGTPTLGEDLYSSAIWAISVFAVCFVGGWIIGSFIMGMYLFVSLHFFGRHDNEAFSALKIEDFKNFLRMHIDSDGKLTIYAFKIDVVPKEWEDVMNDDGTEIIYRKPKDGTKADLIEKVVI